MNREILFRGQRVDNGNWVEGDLVYRYGDKSKPMIHSKVCDITTFANVIPETVGQFTGLLDKNGKKVFEGDKYKDVTGEWIVVFHKSAYSLQQETEKGIFIQAFCNGVNFNHLKHIGNIHEQK
jgi:hypothetical protein